jgi:transposase
VNWPPFRPDGFEPKEAWHGRDSISVVARGNGVTPNLLYRWRRLMLEGETVAVTGDDDLTGNRQVREMENGIRELERELGRKTLEVEILQEALDRSRKRRPCSCARRCRRICGEPGRQHARRGTLHRVRALGRQHRTA